MTDDTNPVLAAGIAMHQALVKVMDLRERLAVQTPDESSPEWRKLRDEYQAEAAKFLDQFGSALSGALTISTNPTGWQPWTGGACPVPPDTQVDYRMRTDSGHICRAGLLDWTHSGHEWDIVAFRVAPVTELPADSEPA